MNAIPPYVPAKRIYGPLVFLLFAFCVPQKIFSEPAKGLTMEFTVSMEQPASHLYHVVLHCEGVKGTSQDFKMPAWTTGYYQILDFAKEVSNFAATDGEGKPVTWEKANGNTWTVHNTSETINLAYDVKGTRLFVATNFLDETHAYLSPAGVFMHISGMIKQPSTVTIKPYSKWKDVETGLEPVEGKPYTFSAPDFDVLYDSPFLIGNLESLPVFTVKGVPHKFVGYNLGDFDKAQFVADLTKIVEAASSIIGEIPYKHYTFLSIGAGGGGIEHLNSASISFSGNGLNTRQGRIKILTFIAHEYFHNYNVKRIRPIELGPFDYDKGSRTNSLWVSEGLSVYYENMVLKRAGIITNDELLGLFHGNMMAFENKPGKLFQTLAQSSYETWSDGPFGRAGDEVNKTISYYDKGPVVGVLLDFAIQHETKNRKSLDDVMRLLYQKYYKEKKRGFTEDELKAAIETIAGKPLPEIFEYVYTTKELDYPKYFSYAGLNIDTTTKALPGAYSGIAARFRNDTLTVSAVDYNSPAWVAGVRARDVVILVDGSKPTATSFRDITAQKKKGDKIPITIMHQGNIIMTNIELGEKKERSFPVKPVESPDKLQADIAKTWFREDPK